MATVKFILDKRTKKTDGTYPIKLIVYHLNSDFLINIGVSVNEQNWDKDKIIGNFKNKTFLNDFIEQKFTDVKNLLLKLRMDGSLRTMSSKELKKRIENFSPEDEIKKKTNELLFKDHAKRFIELNKKGSTKELYQYTLNTIAKHTNLKTLKFTDIDYSWLEEYESELSKTCKTNTISIHLRNIRAVFKNAMKKKLISKDIYPFDDYSIKEEETKHRDLSIDDLVLIRDYPVEPHQERYRDLFMLLFYTIGINMIDILHSTGINDNRLEYRREKTGKYYNIEILPEAQKIIEKYSPGQKYLLNFLDNYSNYKDFLHRTNDNLKELGPFEWVEEITKSGRKTKKKERKPLFPFLTTYYARHTWATIASDLNIPQDTIKKALGHGKKTTTDIYINFDRKKIDAANKKVIAHVRKHKSKKNKPANS